MKSRRSAFLLGCDRWYAHHHVLTRLSDRLIRVNGAAKESFHRRSRIVGEMNVAAETDVHSVAVMIQVERHRVIINRLIGADGNAETIRQLDAQAAGDEG